MGQFLHEIGQALKGLGLNESTATAGANGICVIVEYY